MEQGRSHPNEVYGDYLQLDKILSSQKLLSAEKGAARHEELFFIIVHQVYELWFKQIIADLDSIFALFQAPIAQQDMELILIRLQRINKIFHLLLQEFEVLETMSPLEFLNFRDNLGTMSGFQSYQFRMIETKFGLKRDERMLYARCPYDTDLKSVHKEALKEAEQHTSLLGCIEKWLEGMPFLEKGAYRFTDAYGEAFEQMMQQEKAHIQNNPEFTEEERQGFYKRLDELRPNFAIIFNAAPYQELLKTGQRRFSYKAFMAALFIRLYRHHPLLHLPDMLLTEVVEVNALFTLWRYRHSQMVQKMIGWKSGTGGSSGVQYLQATVEKYNIFADLYLIPMLLLPEPFIPPLPEGLLPPVNYFFQDDV